MSRYNRIYPENLTQATAPTMITDTDDSSSDSSPTRSIDSDLIMEAPTSGGDHDGLVFTNDSNSLSEQSAHSSLFANSDAWSDNSLTSSQIYIIYIHDGDRSIDYDRQLGLLSAINEPGIDVHIHIAATLDTANQFIDNLQSAYIILLRTAIQTPLNTQLEWVENLLDHENQNFLGLIALDVSDTNHQTFIKAGASYVVTQSSWNNIIAELENADAVRERDALQKIMEMYINQAFPNSIRAAITDQTDQAHHYLRVNHLLGSTSSGAIAGPSDLHNHEQEAQTHSDVTSRLEDSDTGAGVSSSMGTSP